MSIIGHRLFGEIIKELTGLNEAELERALQVQRNTHEPLGQLLVRMGLITERDRARALGRQWGVPFVDLQADQLNAAVIALVPKHIMQRFRCLPVSRRGNRLMVAMLNPLDIFAIDQVRLATGLEVDPVITIEEDLNNAITNILTSGSHIAETLKKVANEVGVEEITINVERRDDDISVDQLRELVDDAPIVQLVNMVIQQALTDKASDIHIQPEADRLRVRYRMDGILVDGAVVPKQAQAALISRIKVMAEMDISEKRVPQDGRISLSLHGREYDMRVSSLPGVHGEKVVLRVLDKSGIQITLNKLGFPSNMLETYDRLIHRSYGIILVTGPTGSGKSTTLYATLNQLNGQDVNILTVEDPVEYQLPGLTQVQVNYRAGLTFPIALRTFLRQDPDIILVGETRDAETALISIESALTGHLVFSTLHTNDAPSAATRLIEMGIEPFLISSAVVGVIAQRLVRVLCPRCKEPYAPSAEAIHRMNLPLEVDQVTFYRPKGCANCRGSGYKGRMGVFELMLVDNEVRALILKRSPAHLIREAALNNGMMTLQQDAMQKIVQGITSIDETLRVIYTE